MKSSSERIKGYLSLLKGWKESRPPTLSDLKAWQEIWTINDDDLNLIQEMAEKSQSLGWRFWKREDYPKALDVWSDAWSLSPRDKDFFDAVLKVLDRPEISEDLKRTYKIRGAALQGRQPWKKFSPKILRYIQAGLISAPILLGMVLLIPVVYNQLKPETPGQTQRPVSTQSRNLPLVLQENLNGLQFTEAASELNIYPETKILSVSGILKTGDYYYDNIDMEIVLLDQKGLPLANRDISLASPGNTLAGGGSVVPFRKDFILQEGDIESGQMVSMSPKNLQLSSLPWKKGTPILLTNSGIPPTLKPGLNFHGETWTRAFSSWRHGVLLEGLNQGTKPIEQLNLQIRWKEKSGIILAQKDIPLITPGLPSLKAGQRMIFGFTEDFPEEIYKFSQVGFPTVEYQWKTSE